jgi:hypothetical protein
MSCHAHATITGLRWVEVDNTLVDHASDPVAGAAWLANPAGWRTFNLMVLGDPDTTFTGFTIGEAHMPAVNNLVVYTDGVIFNHGAGGNLLTPNGPIFDAAPLLQFDTLMTIGDLDFTMATGNPASYNLEDGIIGLRGGVGAIGQVFGEEGMLRAMTITVSADFTYLGNYNAPEGLVSRAEVYYRRGFTTFGNATFLLPTVIPAPGVASALTLGGLVAMRRRR